MKRLKYIEDKIIEDISNIQKRCNKNRIKSLSIGLLTIISGACVTIFLGLRIEYLEELFKNIALICGVLVTALNSIEKYFNYRDLWVGQTVHILKLKALYSEIEFFKLGLSNDKNDTIQDEKLNSFFSEYQKIWEDISNKWSYVQKQPLQEKQMK